MKMLTLRDVAEALNLSTTTIRRLVKDGSLTAYKVGKRGQLRIRDEDLETFLDKQRIGAALRDDDREAADDPSK